MNKKLIAVAVAGIVAAPAAYADISAYGRIHNRFQMTDAGGSETQNVNNTGSRFGFKGSGDIGNGMTAFARYEFGTTTDHSKSGGGLSNRLSFVGLSGPFGSISLGQQWSAYYQNVGTHASPNIANGPGQQLGPFRTGNTLQYSNSLGPISLTIDARVQDDARSEEYGVNKKTGDVEKMMVGEGAGNGFGIGATLRPMDGFTLSGGFDSNDSDNTDTMGVSAVASFGAFSVSVSHEQQEAGDLEHNNTLAAVGASVTDRLYLSAAFSQTEMEKADSPTTETDRANVSATYRIGGGLRTWIELANEDSGGSSDKDILAIGLRMDF